MSCVYSTIAQRRSGRVRRAWASKGRAKVAHAAGSAIRGSGAHLLRRHLQRCNPACVRAEAAQIPVIMEGHVAYLR